MWFSCKTRRGIRRLIGCLVLFVLSKPAGAIEQYTETIDQHHWPQYVNGANLLALPQVVQILTRFEEHEKVSIVIHYPGGETGKQWAQTLSNWLISFGIPGPYITLFPGAGAADRLVLTLTDRR